MMSQLNNKINIIQNVSFFMVVLVGNCTFTSSSVQILSQNQLIRSEL